MNIAQTVNDNPAGKWMADTGLESSVAPASTVSALRRIAGFFVRLLRRPNRKPSILRNDTNLPALLALALLLSVVCNFALKESSAQASRYSNPAANLRAVLAQVARDPDNADLHSQLGELYMQQHNFRRAMFHFREASRLAELYGE